MKRLFHIVVALLFFTSMAHAQVKISALPAATTVGGTDSIPIVQGLTTKKAPVSLFVTTAQVNAANGVAGLDASGHIASPTISGATLSGTTAITGGVTMDFQTITGNNGGIVFTSGGQQCTFNAAAFQVQHSAFPSMVDSTLTLDSASQIKLLNSSNILGNNINTTITHMSLIDGKSINITGPAESLIQSGVTGQNTLAIQSTDQNGYPAIRFLHYQGAERGALGYAGDGGTGTVDNTRNADFIEVSNYLVGGGVGTAGPWILNQTSDYGGQYGNTVGAGNINTRVMMHPDGDFFFFPVSGADPCYVHASSPITLTTKSTIRNEAYFILDPLCGPCQQQKAVTTTYGVAAIDQTILCNGTGGAFTATLPTAVGKQGKRYTIKRTNSGSNAVTVGTTSSQTIDGSTTYSLSAQWKYVVVESDGSNWEIVGNN